MRVEFTERDVEGNYLGEGEHVVTIESIEESQSQNGNPMIIVNMADKLGRTDSDRIAITEKSKFRVANLAKAAGFTSEQLKAGEFDTSMLQGKKVVYIKGLKGTDEQGRPNWNRTYSLAPSEELPF